MSSGMDILEMGMGRNIGSVDDENGGNVSTNEIIQLMENERLMAMTLDDESYYNAVVPEIVFGGEEWKKGEGFGSVSHERGMGFVELGVYGMSVIRGSVVDGTNSPVGMPTSTPIEINFSNELPVKPREGKGKVDGNGS